MGKNKQLFVRLWQTLLISVPFIIIASIWEFLVILHGLVLTPDLPPFIQVLSGILNIIALDPLLFPPPSKILTTFIDLLINRHPSLIDHLIRSLFHIFMGYSIGVGFGIMVGTIMGINRTIYNALNPILGLLIPVPTLAWVPLLLIIIGLGDETIIITIFLGCFFPIVYNTLNGIRSTDPQLIQAAEIMGASKIDIYFEVLLPSSLLSTITGLRLAVGYSWRALVGAEMLAGISSGIGHMIYAARWGFQLDVMFTGLIIIAAGGLIMDRLLLRPFERMTVEKWGIIEKRSE